MRLTFAAAITCALLLFPTSGYAADEAQSCDAIELGGAPNYDMPYDVLVCDGIAAMERKDFSRAISLLEDALNTPLFEVQNFVLFPRLALAYHYAGEAQKAQETLEKADFALKIFTRIMDCIEVPDQLEAPHYGYRIVWTGDPDRHQVESPYYHEIANRMCGAIYPRPQSLDQILGEDRLVRHFLAVKLLIQSNAPGNAQGPILIKPQ